jgi:hypothetical protein
LYTVIGGRLLALHRISRRPFSTARLDLLMTVHAKDALRRSRIAKVFDLSLAIAAFEAVCAESLVTSQYSQIFNLVSAAATAVGAVIADQRPVAEEEEVRVGVEQSTAGITAKAINMPPISSCFFYQQIEIQIGHQGSVPSSNALPSSKIYHSVRLVSTLLPEAAYYKPLHSPCRDMLHRPGLEASRGMRWGNPY